MLISRLTQTKNMAELWATNGKEREFTDSNTSRQVELPLREGEREDRGRRWEAENATCFNLTNKGVVSLFFPSLLSFFSSGERGVGFLRCFCPVASRMAFWETWVGRWRSDQQHQVSQCFLHWCLLFVYLQNERHGHLSRSLSPLSLSLSSFPNSSPLTLPLFRTLVFHICF